MTSKEGLKIIYERVKDNLDIVGNDVVDIISNIEKDLEVLENKIEYTCFNPKDCINHIYIEDSIKQLRFHYNGKEYVFDLEKVLQLLCKELDDED